ncbi:MAG: hypothetical protein ACKUBY_04725 [Candidatus Moraniibacteriota bacterium]|jgi:hypothetical protein
MKEETVDDMEPEVNGSNILSKEEILEGFEIIRNFPYDEDEY